MVETIVILMLLGTALVVAEFFIPGLIVGIAGGICLLLGVVLTFQNYGFARGALLLSGLAVLLVIGAAVWITYFPGSRFGRKVTLLTSISGRIEHPRQQGLLGREGRALSDLRPAGVAEIDGQRVDVVAESRLIASGTTVRVVRTEGAVVTVREQPVAEQSAA